MLLAILFDDDDQVVAAAPACDQTAVGNEYWEEIHPVALKSNSYDIAYVEVSDLALRHNLLRVGMDETVSGRDLANQLASIPARDGLSTRAA